MLGQLTHNNYVFVTSNWSWVSSRMSQWNCNSWISWISLQSIRRTHRFHQRFSVLAAPLLSLFPKIKQRISIITPMAIISCIVVNVFTAYFNLAASLNWSFFMLMREQINYLKLSSIFEKNPSLVDYIFPLMRIISSIPCSLLSFT